MFSDLFWRCQTYLVHCHKCSLAAALVAWQLQVSSAEGPSGHNCTNPGSTGTADPPVGALRLLLTSAALVSMDFGYISLSSVSMIQLIDPNSTKNASLKKKLQILIRDGPQMAELTLAFPLTLNERSLLAASLWGKQPFTTGSSFWELISATGAGNHKRRSRPHPLSILWSYSLPCLLSPHFYYRSNLSYLEPP